MKLLMRLFVTAIAAVAANYFLVLCVMFLPYSSFTSSASFRLAQAVAIWGCTAVVALYAWRHTASVTLGLVGCDPGSQGALFGIFVSGPLGVVAGAAGGAIYWRAHSRDEATSND